MKKLKKNLKRILVVLAKTTILLCLLNLLFLINNSCRKKDTVYRISEEAKSWVYFKPGSWWLYKEDSTDIKDCVWVDRAGIYESEKWIDGKMVLKYEYGGTYFTCTDTSVQSLSFRLQAKNDGKTYCSYYYNVPSKGYTFDFDFFTTYDSDIIFNGNITNFTTFSINDKTFSNVKYLKCNIAYASWETNQLTYIQKQCDFWFVKNIGMIKKIIRSPNDIKIWSLINYNIEQ